MPLPLYVPPRKANPKTFWVTNISNRNVSLSDLNISIPAMSSVNLLDEPHYHLTETQVKQSATNGSIFRKSSMIVVRKVPPPMPGKENTISMVANPTMPNRTKSIYEIKNDEYEEIMRDELLSLSGETEDLDSHDERSNGDFNASAK